MKAHATRPSLFALAAFVIAGPLAVDAQIRDDEQSTNYLAVQCAMSSGRNAADFEEYGRKLAKTVAFLSPGQQARVFGYVPQPIHFARPAEAPKAAQSNPTYAAAAAPDAPGNGGDTAADSYAAGLDAGSVTVGNAPDAESAALAGEQGETDPGGTDAAAGSSGTDWWSNALKWLGSVVDNIIADLAARQES